MFSSAMVPSALCSVFEEAQTTAPRRDTGDVPPVVAKPIARFVEHDGEGTAQEKDAKQDSGVLSQGKGLQQLPNPGLTTAPVSEMPHRPCHDPDVADAIPVSETSPRTGCDPSVADAVTVLETSQLPCGDPGVADTTLVLQTSQQPRCNTKIISPDPATTTCLVQKAVKLQGMAKRLLLRRSVNELRRQRRYDNARIQAWRRRTHAVKPTVCSDAGYPCFGKGDMMLDASFYRVLDATHLLLWGMSLLRRPSRRCPHATCACATLLRSSLRQLCATLSLWLIIITTAACARFAPLPARK